MKRTVAPQGTNEAPIRIAYPFLFSRELDPRKVFSVGDQALVEHLFAFHARIGSDGRFSSHYSDVQVDRAARQIRLSRLHPADDRLICDNVRTAFESGVHSPFGKLLTGIECREGGEVLIQLSAIPRNLSHFLTLPEMAVYDPSKTPVLVEGPVGDVFSGPYLLDSRDKETVRLRRNPSYPSELVANTIPNAELRSYDSTSFASLLDSMKRREMDAIYAFGFAVDKGTLNDARQSNYSVAMRQDEWFAYLMPRATASDAERSTLAWVGRGLQGAGLLGLGQATSSITPVGRSTHEETASQPQGKSTVTEILTLEKWIHYPFFQAAKSQLEKQGIKLVSVPNQSASLLFGGKLGHALLPLGISAADPISHLSFIRQQLPHADSHFTLADLARLAAEPDFEAFSQGIQKIEANIVKNRLLIPIAHFPGVVFLSNRFERAEELDFNWGVRAWALRER